MTDPDKVFTVVTALLLLRIEGYQAAGLTYRSAVLAAATDVGLYPAKVLAAGTLPQE